MYIRATGNISPQKTFGHSPFLQELVSYNTNRLACIEPEYKDLIDPKLIRRMSRIIKMGSAAAFDCLQETGLAMPDAIVTGTAYGCLEDTESFLKKQVEHNETLLTPTAFIQSTHNTVGAQIALTLKCHNYNNTFVHRAFSFENAVIDAQMLLRENEAENVLVGAVDEITTTSHKLLSRFGLYKPEPVSSLDIISTHTKGTVAGEGASFFLLANQSSERDYGKLDALATLYKPADISEVKHFIASFLKSQSLEMNDIDLIITGRNGDIDNDKSYDVLEQAGFNNNAQVNYKNLCGEYPTATSFALWMAANLVRNNTIPSGLSVKGNVKEGGIRKILIYNHYHNIHHSLFLVSSC